MSQVGSVTRQPQPNNHRPSLDWNIEQLKSYHQKNQGEMQQIKLQCFCNGKIHHEE